MFSPELSGSAKKEAERRVVRAVYNARQFPELKPKIMRVAELYYLGEERFTLAQIRTMLEPQMSFETVRQRKIKVLEALRPRVLEASQVVVKEGLAALGLSSKTVNPLLKDQERGTLPQDLTHVSDEELLGIRQFGKNALTELRSKVPYVPL